MSAKADEDESRSASSASDTYLRGTTYVVYRYFLKQKGPVGVSQVQKDLGLSSPSVSLYHIRKLLQLGLIREEQAGYVLDRGVLAYIVRVRRVSIPIQTGYVVFFGVSLLFLLLVLRPITANAVYFFALMISGTAFGTSLYEAIKTVRHS